MRQEGIVTVMMGNDPGSEPMDANGDAPSRRIVENCGLIDVSVWTPGVERDPEGASLNQMRWIYIYIMVLIGQQMVAFHC